MHHCGSAQQKGKQKAVLSNFQLPRCMNLREKAPDSSNDTNLGVVYNLLLSLTKVTFIQPH